MQTPILFTLAASPKPYHKRVTSYFIILCVVSTLFVITAGQWGYPLTLANILSPIYQVQALISQCSVKLLKYVSSVNIGVYLSDLRNIKFAKFRGLCTAGLHKSDMNISKCVMIFGHTVFED